jgi:methylenetetrahydrofolate reductase (NADPH)
MSHISSIGASAILARAGFEPIFQMNCRDRNRIAIQSDIVSAAALGVKNMLIMTGDDVSAGDQAGAKRVYDLGSAQLVRTAKIMRDEGVYLSGRKIATPPKLFIGAADNPFIPPFEYRAQRLAIKVEAGADFVQTQYCFDVPRFREHMRLAREMGLIERCYVLVGVGPLRSERTAEYMRTKVPGIYIPDETVARMTQAPKPKKRREGINICLEIIQQVREIPGVRGIHIMAYGMEDAVEEIVEKSGLPLGV